MGLCSEHDFKGAGARIFKKYIRSGLPGHSIVKNELKTSIYVFNNREMPKRSKILTILS